MDIHSQMNKNMEEMVQMCQSRMGQFEKSLAHTQGAMKASSSTAHADLSSLAADYAAFKDLMLQMMTHIRHQLQLLSTGYDLQEARSRKKILLFHGLAENSDEDTGKLIKSVLCDKMQVPDFELSSIDVCHRLGVKTDKPRPVLVRFSALRHKNIVWRSKTVLKGSGTTISEFLTKPRQEVFIAARKHFGIKNCWTSDGVIIIALPDKSRKRVVTSAELQAIIDKVPQSGITQESKQRSRRGNKVPTK